MIAILLASAVIDARRLKMAVGVLAEPRVLIGRGERYGIEAVDGCTVGDSPVAVVIGPIAAHPLAGVARLAVAAVPQHGVLHFTRAIEAHRRAAGGRVPMIVDGGAQCL